MELLHPVTHMRRSMEATEIFYARDRQAWRDWLAAHFETKTEVWFVFPVKASGEAE